MSPRGGPAVCCGPRRRGRRAQVNRSAGRRGPDPPQPPYSRLAEAAHPGPAWPTPPVMLMLPIEALACGVDVAYGEARPRGAYALRRCLPVGALFPRRGELGGRSSRSGRRGGRAGKSGRAWGCGWPGWPGWPGGPHPDPGPLRPTFNCRAGGPPRAALHLAHLSCSCGLAAAAVLPHIVLCWPRPTMSLGCLGPLFVDAVPWAVPWACVALFRIPRWAGVWYDRGPRSPSILPRRCLGSAEPTPRR